MRTLLILAAMIGLAVPAAAQDAKLKIGDKAPAVKATKWWQGKDAGKEVTSFAEGKVYVMEFWAIWCGPCIVMMPHMGELQQQYKDKVQFIGFTTKDNRGNNLERVQSFVEKRGAKLGYTFAYADSSDTDDAWMKAAGQGGIPCCFVVDKAGKIAYIGHPMYLDVVLPKVVEGKWTAEDAEGVKVIEKDLRAMSDALNGEPEAALKALADFEKKYPPLAHIPYFVPARIGTLMKAKKNDDAKKVVEEVIAKAVKLEDPGAIRGIFGLLLSPEAKASKELLPLSVKAAEAMLKLSGEKDAVALYFLAEAHFANGDTAKAKDFGAKAVAAADNENTKKQIEMAIKKFDDKKE